MKLAIVGASGRAGSRLVDEASRRGHHVTGIARNPLPGTLLVAGDARNSAEVGALISGHDAVISAAPFHILGADPLLEALRLAEVTRLVVVGGAGSLEVAPGVALLDTPGFPEEYRFEAEPGRDFLLRLREESKIEWTFISPAIIFEPGERTGAYRAGGDELLVDEDGLSRISMEDFAIAALDEIEVPRHVRERFSVRQ